MKNLGSIWKQLWRWKIGLLGISLCLLLASNWLISSFAASFLYNHVESVPKRKIGLLLGTSPYLSSGERNLYFEYRIQAAADLFLNGKIDYILASGDNHTASYNEPLSMKKALMKKGVPSHAIYLDYAGFSTYESIVRCQKVFQEDSVIIISQAFHNERAVFIANHMDLHAIAFNAKDPQYNSFKVYFREFFAKPKALFDLFILKKQPKYLGEPILIGAF